MRDSPTSSFAQVLEHVEPGCLTALTLPIGRDCRLKLWGEFRQETHALPTGLPGRHRPGAAVRRPGQSPPCPLASSYETGGVAVRSPSKRLPPLLWGVQIAHFRIRIIRTVGIWLRTSQVARRCTTAWIQPSASAEPLPRPSVPNWRGRCRSVSVHGTSGSMCAESALAMGTPPVPHFAGRHAVVRRSPERRCRPGRRGRGRKRPEVTMPRTGIGPSTDGGARSLRELRAHLKYRSRLVERRVRVTHDLAVRRGGAVGLEHARET